MLATSWVYFVEVEMIDISRVKELLNYDPESGLVTWAVSRRWCKASVGDRAGSVRLDGYRTIMIDGVHYFEHRLIWVLYRGEFPIEEIDHINGDRFDNRISNLRLASKSENCINRPSMVNKSGYRGVHERGGTYQARISADRKRYHLGTFETPKEAYAAYVGASIILHKGFRMSDNER